MRLVCIEGQEASQDEEAAAVTELGDVAEVFQRYG